MTNWYLGTMGFAYKQWQGVFYPAGMAARNYLAHYATRFDGVEIDSSFYGTPRRETVQRWTAVTPAHFKFCPKTPREITHDMRLHNVGKPMSHFIDTMRLLEGKLGAILVQFSPDFGYVQKDVVAKFLAKLPTDLRFAVEFRDRSWERQETAVLLRQHKVAWVSTDYIHLQKVVRHTADFLYLRFIGPHGQFATKDKELVDKTAVLQNWQQQIQPRLPQLNNIYGFFNNDFSGYSPATCNRFKEIVGQQAAEIRTLQQGRLF